MSRNTRIVALAGVLALGLPGQLQAQGAGHGAGHQPGGQMPMMQGQMPMMQHGQMPMMQGGATAADTPATAAFKAANARMHQDMAIAYIGDADVDFVKGMIPHHQGAIDMAKVVLAFGKDPEVRKLAEAIVQAQEAEIVQMRAMLERLGK
jgi:uncharacterized protein (DUF305 family)